jgi:hypothetical protein
MENNRSPAPVDRLVGRALDVLIATTVMGWTDEPEFGLMNGERFMETDGPFCPSSNITDAWAVVQRMSDIEQRNAIWWNCTAGAFTCIDIGDDMPKSLGRIMFDCPDKMPLAICLAALEVFGVSPNSVLGRPERPNTETGCDRPQGCDK